MADWELKPTFVSTRSPSLNKNIVGMLLIS